MSADVTTMRPTIVPPIGAHELRHQSACRSVVGSTTGLAANRPWAFDADGKAAMTATTTPPRHLGRRST